MRGQNAAVAFIFSLAIAFLHQHGKTVALLQITDKVDFRAEKVSQLQRHLRAFAHIGHGLEEIVADGGFHRTEQGDVFNGLHPGHGLFDALHHQTAAAVDFVFKTLDPARSRVRDDHIGLALAEGTHGKHLASRADILVDAFAARIFQNFTDGVALFHRAFDHFLTRGAIGLRLFDQARGRRLRRRLRTGHGRVRRQGGFLTGNAVGNIRLGLWKQGPIGGIRSGSLNGHSLGRTPGLFRNSCARPVFIRLRRTGPRGRNRRHLLSACIRAWVLPNLLILLRLPARSLRRLFRDLFSRLFGRGIGRKAGSAGMLYQHAAHQKNKKNSHQPESFHRQLHLITISGPQGLVQLTRAAGGARL